MRGHLQHRGETTWRVKVYLGRSADGRKRYLERTVHGSRERPSVRCPDWSSRSTKADTLLPLR